MQITMAKSIDDEPRTVSYNTKVFNKEIIALREEEEALLKHQNLTRQREYRVDQMKYKPTDIEFRSVRNRSNPNLPLTIRKTPNSNVKRSNAPVYSSEVDLSADYATQKPSGRKS